MYKRQEVDAEYGKVFAKTEVELNGAKEPGNRTEEDVYKRQL